MADFFSGLIHRQSHIQTMMLVRSTFVLQEPNLFGHNEIYQRDSKCGVLTLFFIAYLGIRTSEFQKVCFDPTFVLTCSESCSQIPDISFAIFTAERRYDTTFILVVIDDDD